VIIIAPSTDVVTIDTKFPKQNPQYPIKKTNELIKILEDGVSMVERKNIAYKLNITAVINDNKKPVIKCEITKILGLTPDAMTRSQVLSARSVTMFKEPKRDVIPKVDLCIKGSTF
jgi:hypothetical protein